MFKCCTWVFFFHTNRFSGYMCNLSLRPLVVIYLNVCLSAKKHLTHTQTTEFNTCKNYVCPVWGVCLLPTVISAANFFEERKQWITPSSPLPTLHSFVVFLEEYSFFVNSSPALNSGWTPVAGCWIVLSTRLSAIHVPAASTLPNLWF